LSRINCNVLGAVLSLMGLTACPPQTTSDGGAGGSGGGVGATGGGSAVSAPLNLDAGVTLVLPARVTLRGRVVSSRGAAIQGAQIRAGVDVTMSDGSGAFSIETDVGRIQLTAQAPGHLSVRRMIDSNTDGFFDLVLPSVGQLTPISGSDVTVQLGGGATLEISSGAFSTSGTLSTLWLGQQAAARSSPGPLFFLSSTDRLVRVVGVLHGATAAAQVAPVRLTVPTRGSGAMATLHELQPSGAWSESGLMPVASTATTATFDVPHFSEWGLASPTEDLAVEPSVVSMLTGEATVSVAGAAHVPLEVGDEVPPQSTIVTSEETTVTLNVPTGEIAELSGQAQEIQYLLSSPEPGGAEGPLVSTDCVGSEPCTQKAIVRSETIPPRQNSLCPQCTQGQMCAPATGGQFGCTRRFRIRTRSAVIGVRGTAATMVSSECGQGQQAMRWLDVSVSEGAVEVLSAGSRLVGAGQRYKACSGCADPATAGCCDAATSCDAGCCDLSTSTCTAGSGRTACGEGGGACEDCTAANPGAVCFQNACTQLQCPNQLFDCVGGTSFGDLGHARVTCTDGITREITCDARDGLRFWCQCSTGTGRVSTTGIVCSSPSQGIIEWDLSSLCGL